MKLLKEAFGHKRPSTIFVVFLAIILPVLLSFLTLPTKNAHASIAGWSAGNIIGDGVFTNAGTLNASEIQQFMNSKVTSCDTNGTQPATDFGRPDLTHAQYASMVGWPAPPYTCLENYSENGLSAAQIVYNVSQQYMINPEVLLVLLQKEQGLVTDTWPLPSQYQTATGYGCPDSTGCSATYYGFTNQVTWAAKMFRAILNQSPTWYSPYVLGNNYVHWNPNTSCGGSTVNIQNLSTAALYDYTPYQPNQAALNAGYGMGDNCSSYGNRNFYLYFTDWFGSTHTSTPYAWRLVGQSAYADSSRTTPLNPGYNGSVIVAPGQTVYMRVQGQNIGYMGWDTNTHLGTSNPTDRSSAFADASWLSPGRIAMTSTSAVPGTVGAFDFSITAPQQAGRYTEYFNLLQENVTWMNDPGMYFTFDVIPRVTPSASATTLTPGQVLDAGNHLISPDMQSVLSMQHDGNLVIYSNFQSTWSSQTPNHPDATYLVMQSDGNLVSYNALNQPIWASGTSGNANAYAALQTDGNLVVYSSTGTPLWNSGTAAHPDYPGRVEQVMPVADLYTGQSLQTVDRKHQLILQSDGNLVLYSSGTPIWASGTHGQNVSRLTMQSDGNLVLYATNGTPIWNSQTMGNPGTFLAIQSDGNLVLYSPSGAIWSSRTVGY